MKTLILTAADLKLLVQRVGIHHVMDQLIESLLESFANYDAATTEIPNRTGFYYDTPRTGLIEWMPLYHHVGQDGGRVLMKMVGYHPFNPSACQLPTILSTFSTFDTDTGHLLSMVDGTLLTALRTGAASAVASRLLARPDSQVLGLVGCGAQAVTQLHAVSRVFDLTEVLIQDVDPQIEDSFLRRSEGLLPAGAVLKQVPIEQLIEESDIVSVATAVPVGAGPVFHNVVTKPWLHINAVGSDLPGKFELPLELLQQSFVCADNPEQACREGECQQLGPETLATGLAKIARAPNDYVELQAQRTVFDSTGWALEDHVITELVLDWAQQHDLGAKLEVEIVPDDPWNPYDFLTGEAELRPPVRKLA